MAYWQYRRGAMVFVRRLVGSGVTDGARTRDIQSHNLDVSDFVDESRFPILFR